MVAKQLYSTHRTKETHDGGFAYMMKRIERDHLTADDLLMWRFELTDTPKDERGPFWMGQWDATDVAFDALVAKEA